MNFQYHSGLGNACKWLYDVLPLFCFTTGMMHPDIYHLCLFICLQVGAMPSEALGLSPVALLLLTYLRVQTYVGSLRLSWLLPQTDGNHTFRTALQTDLVTIACVLSSKCLCLDTLHAFSTYFPTLARSRLLFSLLFQA